MVTVPINRMMEASILEIMSMERKMDMEHIIGQVEFLGVGIGQMMA